MRQIEFKRKHRGPGPTIRLFLMTAAALYVGFSLVLDPKGTPGNTLMGLIFLAMGIGVCVLLVNLFLRHPVELVFDETGFGGPRVRQHVRKQRVPWDQIAAAELKVYRDDDDEVAAGHIEVKLTSGKEFALDVHHLEHLPTVIFGEFEAFRNGTGYRLAKVVEAK